MTRDEKIISQAMRLLNKRRTTKAGGRPRSEDRCHCGRMTRARAEKRGHRCGLISRA